jgi:hypothetical protein
MSPRTSWAVWRFFAGEYQPPLSSIYRVQYLLGANFARKRRKSATYVLEVAVTPEWPSTGIENRQTHTQGRETYACGCRGHVKLLVRFVHVLLHAERSDG